MSIFSPFPCPQRTLACSISCCSRSALSPSRSGGEPICALTLGGSTVLNSLSVALSCSMAPKSRQQMSRWICRDCSSRPVGPPLHLVVPPICGPKKTASSGPGEVLPRQLSLPALQGFELRGALQETNREDQL